VAQSERSSERIEWLRSIPFLTVHLVAVATLLFSPLSSRLVLLAMGSYVLRVFGITAGYHRYFAHRSYRTGRTFQFLLALLGATATQKGPLWWAGYHREHHRFSDGPKDIHSPLQRGFWWSHIGWIMSNRYAVAPLDRIRDFARYPELCWLDRFHAVPPIAYASALFVFGGWSGVLWGYFVSTLFLWHATFTVNSLAHVFGSRRYETGDDSRNNLLIALATMGEGWHNNHHHYQSAVSQGWFWWEIDPTYYALRVLASLGVVSGLRLPPVAVREGGRVGHGGSATTTTQGAS